VGGGEALFWRKNRLLGDGNAKPALGVSSVPAKFLDKIRFGMR